MVRAHAGGPDSAETANFLAEVPNKILSKPIAPDLLRATVAETAQRGVDGRKTP